MSLDAIKQVTETERKTLERRAQAQAEAKKILADAEQAGRARVEAARAEAEAQVSQFIKEAEKEASKRSAAVMDETAQTCQDLSRAAEGRMAKAAGLIVRRVVNS